ncbi:methyltransferase [Streptomyces sp. SBT349]|uniref:methyltransferase n=1 Tax=Streptomyces sp. SBT349 TaxID=1580539 RepID=UPI00066E68D3|nr:methyltransferase [Streptomyces sp. SBT349]
MNAATAPDTPPPGASALMAQMLGGFQISQALYAVAKFDLATALDDGPLTVGDLAWASGTHRDALSRLIRALAPLGVFRTDGDLVGTTDLGATLSATHPRSVRGAALYWMETHYLPFSQLPHTLRTGEPAADHYLGEPFFDWVAARPEMIAVQNEAMADLTASLRGGLLDGYTLPAGNVVADLGGADGTVLWQLLRKDPSRRGIVLDLPQVVPSARDNLARRGLDDRVEAVPGNFFDAVPVADVYLLAYILHDWDDDSCLRVLGNIARAARPGARLVVIEGLVPDGDAPHLTKMIDLTMLTMLTGRERGAEEFEKLLTSGGFDLDRVVSGETPFSILEATLR